MSDRETAPYRRIAELERENQLFRDELNQQAICNGAGASRELALRSTIAELQRENAALRAVFQAAKAMTDYEHEGAAVGWPDWDSRFDALKSAIDAARKEQP